MLLRFRRRVVAPSPSSTSSPSAAAGVHRATAPGRVVRVMAEAEAAAVAVGKDVLRVLYLLAINLLNIC